MLFLIPFPTNTQFFLSYSTKAVISNVKRYGFDCQAICNVKFNNIEIVFLD